MIYAFKEEYDNAKENEKKDLLCGWESYVFSRFDRCCIKTNSTDDFQGGQRSCSIRCYNCIGIALSCLSIKKVGEKKTRKKGKKEMKDKTKIRKRIQMKKQRIKVRKVL